MTGARPRRAAAESVAVAVTLAVIAALVVLLAGASPLMVGWSILTGALGDRYAIGDTLALAGPIALVGLGVAPALIGGFVPVGGEGQIMAGALVATACVQACDGAPPAILIGVGMIAGLIGGLVWALPAAVLRARLGVSEILSGLMLNYLAAAFLGWSLRTWLGGAATGPTPHSDPLPKAALLAPLIAGTHLHAGLLLVPPAALALAWWRHSRIGLLYAIRPVAPQLGLRFGIGEAKAAIVSLPVAGGLAGIAGWMQVAGQQGILYPGVGGGLGLLGLLAALLGRFWPGAIGAAAIMLAVIAIGIEGVEADTGLSASLATVLEGLLLLLVASAGARRVAP